MDVLVPVVADDVPELCRPGRVADLLPVIEAIEDALCAGERP